MTEVLSKDPTAPSTLLITEVKTKEEKKKKDVKVFNVENANLPEDELEAVGKLPDNVLPKQITVHKLLTLRLL
jgi:hypothetical protein